MQKLSPRAESLVHRGRDALRPTQTDRERVFAALRTRLGAGAGLENFGGPADTVPPAAAGATLPLAAGRSIWSAVSVTLVGLGIVGGASVIALGFGRSPVNLEKGLRARVATIQTAAPVAIPAEEAAMPVESHARAPSEAPAPSARRAQSRLAEEVAILSRAAGHLRARRAAEALKALDEHQQKFPSGALTEERRAAKAEALCALGRVAEADAILSRLGSKSPHAARARQFCSARSKAPR
jgi:hypothetical protein